MLKEEEISRIFSWLPYREDWPAGRNQSMDSIKAYHSELTKQLTQNKLFDTYSSEDGGLGNYLEFLCYPIQHHAYEGNCVMVCVSLCAPVAAYGQTTIWKTKDSFGRGEMFNPEKVNLISDVGLYEIEKEIRNILASYRLHLLDKVVVSRLLPAEIEGLKYENHNEGNQYLHGFFQKTD
ncbi:MAG TPA: hypothetical protein VMR70_20180 [Flavisolibacter sp.]|nr:hypothetical protein [Flavisolibacter sp.]